MQQTYMYNKWEEYGYLDYVPYSEWLQELSRNGELDEETRAGAAALGRSSVPLPIMAGENFPPARGS